MNMKEFIMQTFSLTEREFIVFLLFVSATFLFALLITAIVRFLRNPFKYPYFEYSFDVSHKRKVNIDDYVDTFLCDEDNWIVLQDHYEKIRAWKRDCKKAIRNSTFVGFRTRQFNSVLDDEEAFNFYLTRQQTRYTQKNYVRSSYKVETTDEAWSFDWDWICERRAQLAEIGFESTLSAYHSKNQRKLMTPALRKSVMERDNYTCQICGKYMPDEVGLHIDHITPIAKGGKSVLSNLQVLCSKCNGSKGSK